MKNDLKNVKVKTIEIIKSNAYLTIFFQIKSEETVEIFLLKSKADSEYTAVMNDGRPFCIELHVQQKLGSVGGNFKWRFVVGQTILLSAS